MDSGASGGDLRPGQLLAGRYRLRRRLGAGGMSVVWQAYDRVLERPVAIKVMATERAGEPEFRRRVRSEARAAARLVHPHVVNVFDYVETVGPDGTVLPFVVMELVIGRSLEQRLAAGPLPWPLAVRIGAQVADALATAHERGVVHRDVTAGNVILTGSGAKVVDFGISAAVGDRDGEPGAATLLGTPAYLAPERLGGLPVAPAADVYSLGVLLHTMLAGTTPFEGDTTTAVTRAHWYRAPAALPPIDGLPPAVDRLRRRCLAKRARDRPTAAEVAAALTAVTAAPVPDPGPEPGPAPNQPVPAPGVGPAPASQPAPSTGPVPAPEPASQPASGAGPVAPPDTRPPSVPRPVPDAEPVPRPVPVGGPADRVTVALPAAGTAPTAATVPDRRRRQVLVVAAILLAVMAGAAALTATLRPGDTPPASAGHDEPMPPHSGTPSSTARVGDRPSPSTRATGMAPVPVPPRSASPTPAPSAVPPRCTVVWTVTDAWDDGFNASIAVHSEARLSGFTLTFSFPADQRVTNGWGGDFSQRGHHVTVRSLDWNRDAGQALGLTASFRTANPPPTTFTLNGTRCSTS